MKKSAVARIVIWSVVAVLLIGILVGSLVFATNPNITTITGEYENYRYDHENEYSVGNIDSISAQIQNIEIDWVSGKVNLIPYDGDTVKVEEFSVNDIEEKYELRWRVKENTLYIKPCESTGTWNLANKIPTKTLCVYLPEALAANMNKIEIDTASAWISVTGVTATEIDTATASGDTWFEKCTVTNLNIENVSGYTNCTEVNAEKIDAETVSGNIDVLGNVKTFDAESVSGTVYYGSSSVAPDSADISTVSGEIKLRLPDNDGFNIRFDSVSGKITSDFPLTINGGDKTYGNGNRSYDLETVSGNVNIELEA